MERVRKPEDAGVRSGAIVSFLKEIESAGAENHGLIVIRNDKIAFEGYRYPYSAETPHTMFSVTKSLVSTAIGFAVSEGLLTLDEKIEPHFSEYFHIKSKRWDRVTVESLLTMRSGKVFTFLQDMTADYAKLFMMAPFRGNNKFLYSNNDAYMLSALLQKVTGKTVVDYLTPRLFEPLGIKKPFWETNGLGVCVGGTGCYLTVPDMAKIGYCYLSGGKYDGKQVLPVGWAEQAQTWRTETTEKGTGYGYYFWLRKDCFMMDGMMGQFCMIFPKYNAVVAMTNCSESEKFVLDAFYRVYPDIFTDEEDELAAFVRTRGEKIAVKGRMPEEEKKSEGETYVMVGSALRVAKISGYPLSLIPHALNATVARRPDSSMDNVRFDFDESGCTLSWNEGEDIVVCKSGMNGEARLSDVTIAGYPYTLWSYAYWEGKKLHVVIRILNTLATQRFIFSFSGQGMRMEIKSKPDFGKFCSENAVAGGAVPDIPYLTPLLCKNIEQFAGIFDRPVRFVKKHK